MEDKLVLFIYFILSIILAYAVFKERQELGCHKIGIETNCDDGNSVYVKDTKMEPADTCENLYDRIISILSYHEKGGVWKRALIISVIICLCIYLVFSLDTLCGTKENVFRTFLILFLLIFTIIYLYHNYNNYHHFRLLKNNGVEIIEKIKTKC